MSRFLTAVTIVAAAAISLNGCKCAQKEAQMDSSPRMKKTCRWLFLDRSKNHSRRWCDMRICGNRSKTRRFYARQRDSA